MTQPTSPELNLELSIEDLEIRLLLEAIFIRYHYDFRQYAMSSLRRRLQQACSDLSCRNLSHLQERLLHEDDMFPRLLRFLTVQVSDLFRDPTYYQALRDEVLPVLSTHPSLRIWIAGCSQGEEVYSMAILLAEAGLLERSLIYATDISPNALRAAENGVYSLDRLPSFTQNYAVFGGRRSLSDYYTAGYGAMVFNKSLKQRVVFSDHSLSTDQVFAEVHLVSCRNVLIYFNRALQDRALGLFHEALINKGFLGLGSKESIRFSTHAAKFAEIDRKNRVYQRLPSK